MPMHGETQQQFVSEFYSRRTQPPLDRSLFAARITIRRLLPASGLILCLPTRKRNPAAACVLSTLCSSSFSSRVFLFTPKPQIARVIPIPTQLRHACRAARNPEGKLRPVAARTMASSNSNSNSNAAAPAAADGGDDLDQLLDSALDDFTSLDLSASAAPKRY